MDWILLAIITPVVAISGVVGMAWGKRILMKMPVMVAGFPKKNCVAFRDERLKPAMWRSRFWVTLLSLDLCFLGAAIGMELALGNWVLVAVVAALCAVAALPLERMRRKRWRDFLAEAEALGALEREPQAVAEAQQIAIGGVNRHFGQFYIAFAIFSALMAVINFILRAWLPAALLTAAAASYVVFIVYLRVKRKRK